MIEPNNPMLKARAGRLKGPTVESRARTGGRSSNNRRSLPAGGLRVDRNAITYFLYILSLLLAAYVVAGPSTTAGEWGLVNAICPVVLCLAALWTGYAIITKNPQSMWTPVPWFALTTALNCGLGPLLFVFGSDAAIENKNSYWPVGPAELWRVNLLNTISLLTICASFWVTDNMLETTRLINGPESPASDSIDRAKRAAVVFLSIGLPIRYLLVLPFVLGISGFVLPGSVFALNSLAKLSLFMLAYLGIKRQGGWRVGFWALFIVEIVSTSLELGKHEMIVTLLMVALGRYLANRNVKELALSGVAVLGVYVLLSPVVTWTRLQLSDEYGHYDLAPASARLTTTAEALELYVHGELEVADSDHSWWGRVCYANEQTAAMQLYDSGSPGNSFEYAFYSWIPRFIWPDKPIINLGEQFTILSQGHGGNSTGPGPFAESYWNGGWPIVFLACGYIGAIFAFMSRVALSVLARSDWELLPCAFLGIHMGLRMDGWFAPGYITGFLMYLGYYYIIRSYLTFNQARD